MFFSFIKGYKFNQLFQKHHRYKKKRILVKGIFPTTLLLAFIGKGYLSYLNSKFPFSKRGKAPTTGYFSRGFQVLTLGLPDGEISVPFPYLHLSFHQKENWFCPMDVSIDGRKQRARLRNESQEKAPNKALLNSSMEP